MIHYLFFVLFFCSLHLEGKTHYSLLDEPIDVVIVAHPKDKETLGYCIEGMKENCKKTRRIIVISSEKLTDQAEWFDENEFPFNQSDVGKAIVRGKGNNKKGQEFLRRSRRGPGWYFQQLLKLYAPFVIPNISSNVLVIDADTIFMNPVNFLNDALGGLFCFSRAEARKGYLKHAERLVPGYQRIYPEVYSVCHHMLFQRAILEDLFCLVEQYHKTPFWKAFCACVDLQEAGASEYEIYYNYALRQTEQVQLRELIWSNSSHLDEREDFKRAGYHFVAFHSYMKGKWPKTWSK